MTWSSNLMGESKLPLPLSGITKVPTTAAFRIREPKSRFLATSLSCPSFRSS